METEAHDSPDAANPDVVAVFVANHRTFLDFVQKRVGSRAVAEDLLQEAFVRSANVRADDEKSVIAWFYATLRNSTIDYHRRQQTATKALSAFAAELETLAVPEPELRDAICQCVGRLAKTLKPELSAAIARVELDGVAVKDFAAEAGISPGNAAVRVFRAREALRKQVARSCGSCATHGCMDCTCAPKV